VDTVRLILDMNGIASKYGISIKTVTISNDPKAAAKGPIVIGADQSPYGTLGLSFEVTSTYANFIRFLTDLEQSLRIIDITSVSLAPQSGVAAGLNYNFTVIARTYWLKPIK
jgi:Tfp pilus assembly protein PilO